MKYWRLVFRSIVYYWRTHAVVYVGTMVSSAVLVGALVVGDSVRYSLRQNALSRLGRTEYAVTSESRFVRTQLADDLSVSLGADVAPVLQLGGIAIKDVGALRIGNIQVLGVDNRFWEVGGLQKHRFTIGADEAVINERLGSRLNLGKGDELLLRIEKVGQIPGDMPFASEIETSVALRVAVKAVASDEEFGRFSLRADQSSPFNVFLALNWLGEMMEVDGRANVFLFGEGVERALAPDSVYGALKKNWTLIDAGLQLRPLLHPRVIELTSERVFLEGPIVDAAFQIGSDPTGVLSYFVNRFRAGNRITPYSFISAPGEPIVPPDMADDEIIVNEWLSEDLQVSIGDELEIDYYILGPSQRLIERTSTFKVREVVPLQGRAGDMELMPDFPGLAGVENCRDWKPGVPIDLAEIRLKDEEYWNKYRGIPKAFVTLGSARTLWENRFGSLTAIRYESERKIPDEIAYELLTILEPASIGFRVVPVREEGIKAGMGAVDFGQLFIGLSMFIIGASTILVALFFAFGIEQRSEESGILLSLGFSPSTVRRLLLIEGSILAVAGSFTGAVLGILYNSALLYGLNTVWRGAVGTSGTTALKLYVRALTLMLGSLGAICIAVLTMWITARKQTKREPALLQRPGALYAIQGSSGVPSHILVILGISLILAAFVSLMYGVWREGKQAGSFFTSGALLLTASLTLFYAFLWRKGGSLGPSRVTIFGMALSGFARRPKRSIAVSGLLAFGIFIVCAVGANRGESIRPSTERESGTGGFALYCETTMPVLHDLNSEKAWQRFGLADLEKDEVQFVQIRLHEGDDASCLNLNRVETPPILGVRPLDFERRGAFPFVTSIQTEKRQNPWLLLNSKSEEGTIPAVADQSVITWGLHKKIGDTILYTDEQGREFKLKLVGGLKNSIFQGSVLISESLFLQRFPSASGHRVFLVDAPLGQIEKVSEAVQRALRDFGVELVPTDVRLSKFNEVQNTYLSIYLLLGGLGLVVGSFGMGLVVLRNVLERRGELALLRSIGFSRRSIRMLLFIEHSLMFVVGLICGIFSSIIAVAPVLFSRGDEVPFMFLVILCSVIAVNGALWVYLATIFATRGSLLQALRNE